MARSVFEETVSTLLAVVLLAQPAWLLFAFLAGELVV